MNTRWVNHIDNNEALKLFFFSLRLRHGRLERRGSSGGTAARAARAAHGIPGGGAKGSPRDLGSKDPDGFPWDPISRAQGSLGGSRTPMGL